MHVLYHSQVMNVEDIESVLKNWGNSSLRLSPETKELIITYRDFKASMGRKIKKMSSEDRAIWFEDYVDF